MATKGGDGSDGASKAAPRARGRGHFDVDGRPCSWLRDGAMDGRPVLVLGHGAGAPMTSDFMQSSAEALAQRGLCVVRFHFPYMERMVREGRRRPPDGARVLLAAWRAALAKVAQLASRRGVADGVVLVGGKSMGGRMASMLLAGSEDTLPAALRERVRGAVYLGYPLHPPGRPERLRADHLPDVGVPQLFVSGTRDSLCDLELLRPVLRRIRRSAARLHVVEGGDHSLGVRGPQAGQSTTAWLDAVAGFVQARAAEARQ